MTSSRGFDQGCPLAAAAFAVGQRVALDPYMQQLRHVDPAAKMHSYLDDTYLVVEPSVASLAVVGLTQALAPLGLALNTDKTAVWSPAGRRAVPTDLQANYVEALPVLGSHLKAPGDSDEAPLFMNDPGHGLQSAKQRLTQLWQRLGPLMKAGLKRQAVGALLRAYAGPASQYASQLSPASDIVTAAYDDALKAVWASLAERNVDDDAAVRMGLPAKLGGVGVQWAKTRRYAAYWAGWTAAIEHVQDDLGLLTIDGVLQALPRVTQELVASNEGMRAQGLPLAEGAGLAEALMSHAKQKHMLARMHKTTLAEVRDKLPTDMAKACFLGAGGPGAAGFLQYPEDSSTSMEDVHWSVALRQRLGMRRAECAERELPIASSRCCCRRADGQQCGHDLDEDGFHGCTCQCGGGVLKRHGGLEVATGGLVKRWRLEAPLYEQRVPSWDRQRRRVRPGEDPIERAILDIEYHEGNIRRWIDVSVRHSGAGNVAERTAAARRQGEAARRGEREKHQRYDAAGDSLTAFVVEAAGCIGGEARQWLRQQAAEQPDDLYTKELTRACKVVSCAVQSRLALQLRRAAGLR